MSNFAKNFVSKWDANQPLEPRDGIAKVASSTRLSSVEKEDLKVECVERCGKNKARHARPAAAIRHLVGRLAGARLIARQVAFAHAPSTRPCRRLVFKCYPTASTADLAAEGKWKTMRRNG